MASGPCVDSRFLDFQLQSSLMTGCTLLWKDLSDHFTELERNLLGKSEELMNKIRALDKDTKGELKMWEEREKTINDVVEVAMEKVKERERAVEMMEKEEKKGEQNGEVDDGDGLLLTLRSFCTKMNSKGFWRFVITKKKEMDSIRAQMPVAIGDCVDPARFVLEAISEVFPVDMRVEKSERVNDLGWACVLMLESLIPLVEDPVFGKSRLLVTPKMKERAREIAEAWKASLDERGGIKNVMTPDVHTFLQHLVTFGIVKKEDVGLYRKLVIASAWRKQMPKLAVSLGLGDRMPDMIEELISRGQQVDAVHFTFEVGLQDKFPPVPLLKAFLNDAKKAAGTILEDPNNSGRSAHLAARKEQSALRAVIKCIEEYKLEAEFPSENLKKRLEQLEKTKTSEKRKPVAVPANKRTRANIGGPMPPSKAGRSTNAYVSSFPAAPTYTRSPAYTQYPTGVPQQFQSPPTMYSSNRSPPYIYSPETVSPPMASYPGIQVNYSPYGGYVNGVVPAYHQAYYR